MTRFVARGVHLTPAGLVAAFRPAAARDLEAVLDFRRSVIGFEVVWDDRRYLAWRYGLGDGRPCFAQLFVLEVAGRVIGCIGAEEVRLACPPGSQAAGSAMDIAVLPEYRLVGLGPWLTLALFRRYAVTLALSANEQSLRLVTKLYAPLQARGVYQIPVDLNTFLRRHIHSVVLAGAVAKLFGGIVRMRNRALIRRGDHAGVTVRQVDRFRPEWDASLRAAPRMGVTHIERTAAYLNWRYLENPRAHYRLLASFKGEDLAAFAVYRGFDTTGPGRSLEIADWWCAGSDPGALSPLIAELVAEAVRGGYDALATAALGAEPHAVLRHAGFLARRTPNGVAGFTCSDAGLAALLADASAWHLTGLGDDLDGF